MGLNAAVQALKKAEPLKDKVQRCRDLLNDNDAWVCQQQLQKIYQQVLILDLEYALDRKIEQELWNLGFKNYIAMLQSQAKDRKNPKRSESQAMLSWCLEAASGFYLTLLQEICTAFDLDLPFRRKGYIYGCVSPWKAVEKISTPHKSSCFYACQYCLVHLGDIARYRNQNRQAELFYRHAVSLSPSSGQPYNQLALLEASRGDKLGTVFHYVRSVAVKHPFPVATANLAKTLSSALNDNSFNINGKTKLNSQEYVIIFSKLHGILHNLGDLKLANNYAKLLTETLTALVATESFSSWRLIQMLIINLYALHHVAGNSFETTMELLKVEQLSSDEKIARNCILDLIAGSLSALLLPVYTIKNSYLDYFALPTIKLCLDWIRLQPMILEENAFVSRLQIWPSLCVLLNGLQNSIADFKYDQFSKTPLPEDRDLQGFLPIEKSFDALRFSNTDLEGDIASINKLRAVRLLNLGRHLAECQINGSSLINIVADDDKQEKFTCLTYAGGPSNELMKELEELSLNKERQVIFATSPVPSESASSKASSETEIAEQSLFERKVGILKLQGSLERCRDSLASSSSSNPESAIANFMDVNGLQSFKKTRQNIAMQAILRRAETEQKQVTFKNISPMLVEETDQKQNQPESEILNQVSMTHLAMMTASNLNQNFENNANQPTILAQQRSPVGPNLQNVQNFPVQSHHQIPMSLGNNPCFTNDQQNLQNLPRPSYPGSNADFNAQSFNVRVEDPQFDKGFIVNRLPCMTQFPPPPLRQFNMQQQVQRVPTVQSPSTASNPPIPNVLLNIPSSMVHHHQQQEQIPVPNLQFIEPTIHLSQQQNIGISGIPNSINYQKNVQANFPINSNGISNLQMGFEHVPRQNSFEPMNQISQLNKAGLINQVGQFNKVGPINQLGQFTKPPPNLPSNLAFQSQSNDPTSSHQQPRMNYPIFRNYETTEFNLWKDTPPQPPVTWWSNSGTRNHPKEMTIPSDTEPFQTWANSPVGGRLPVSQENNFPQKQNIGEHLSIEKNESNSNSHDLDEISKVQNNTVNTYSLFSGDSWGVPVKNSVSSSQEQPKSRFSQQSLWSGPGPSPLERLLEQQKSLREGGT